MTKPDRIGSTAVFPAIRLAQIAAVAAAYVVTGRLGVLLAIPPGIATAVWAPSGVALAASLFWGPKVWPGVWLGSCLVNIWTLLDGTNLSSLVLSIGVVGNIAVGSTLQSLLGAYLIRRLIGPDNPFDHVRDLFTLTGLVMLVCLVASTIGATSLLAGGFLSWADYARTWWTWWLGDLTGILLIVPIPFIWTKNLLTIRWTVRHAAEALVWLALLLAVGWVAFGSHPTGVAHYPIAYVLIPLVVWAAFRFDQPGVLGALLLVASITIWGTLKGYGPFIRGTVYESLFLLQSFVSVVTVTGLALAAAIAQQRHAEAALEESERRFRALIDNSSEAIALTNAAGAILFASPSTTRILGYRDGELIGHQVFEFIHPDDRDSTRLLFARLLQTPRDFVTIESRIRSRNGTWQWMEGIAVNLLADRTVHAIVLNYRDIAERKRAAHELQRYADRLKTLREIDRAILASQSKEEIARVALHHLRQLVPYHRLSVYLFDLKAQEAVVLAVDVPGITRVGPGARIPLEAFSFERVLALSEGKIWAIDDMSALPSLSPLLQDMRDEGLCAMVNVPLLHRGELIGALSLGTDRPERADDEQIEICREVADLLALAIQQTRLHEQVQRHTAELRYQTMHDPLTGVPNRILFKDRLEQALRGAEREHQTIALLILDVDGFKQINDTLGHLAGDQVLKQVGSRLRSALRAFDTLARLGGDEFGVILPNTDVKGGELVAEKIVDALVPPIQVEERALRVQASIGIAVYPQQGYDIRTLMRHADMAMYEAKHSRCRFAVYAGDTHP
jgi:diguanylate cyclase (GGDEF)-like protein/PAS domain S-box-containing protein